MSQVTSGSAEGQLNKTLAVGRIVSVYGIKGWVRVRSFTEPEENVFNYQPWRLQTAAGWQEVKVDHFRADAKGYVVHLAGVDDRDLARNYCQKDIFTDSSQFPELASGEFYWHQLEGLVAFSCWHGNRVRLGRVKHILETGANDVLVIKGDRESCDQSERLVPYGEQFIKRVDLQSGEIDVDWDPEF